jgi:hypothetical protein
LAANCFGDGALYRHAAEPPKGRLPLKQAARAYGINYEAFRRHYHRSQERGSRVIFEHVDAPHIPTEGV